MDLDVSLPCETLVVLTDMILISHIFLLEFKFL
jgi:hypothetical protein